MKRLFILSVVSFISINLIFGNKNDTISTRYNKGEFYTFCQINQPYTDSISQIVINRFVKDMCYDIRGLFEWGLKGMSLANQKDELLYFDFRETKYNKQTGILKGIGDVIVPGITTFKDISVDSKLSYYTLQNGVREVKLDLATPNIFIRDLHGKFVFIPGSKNQNGYFQLITRVRFAWFFDVFVTQSRYKKIMEWRIRKVLFNLREESGKLAKKTK